MEPKDEINIRGGKYMNPRDRVCMALNHKEPDKVPIELNGHNCSALTKGAYIALRQYLGLEEDKKIDISDLIQGVVRAKEDILQLYEVDTRSVYLRESTFTRLEFLPDGSFYDAFGAKWKRASKFFDYYDCIERPLKNINEPNDLINVKWEDPYDKTVLKGLKKDTFDLFNKTNYCLVGDIHSWGPFEGGCILRGYDKFLTDLYFNKKLALAIMDKLTETCIARFNNFLNEVGNYIQVCCQGDDLGTQTNTFIDPKMYREIIKPFHERIFSFVHSKTKAKVLLHSCGSIYDIIPDLIEIGVDIINPVQKSAAKMNIAKLKKEFGSDICFWGGGIDVQKELPYFSLKEIEQEVKKTIEIMAPGGGFIFFPTHNIQTDIPTESINTMFESVIKYRNYK